ncbi:MAG: IS1 family transposase [Sphingomonadales bacterium]|nr:IS1 family transposase [Sphingomonadales bacterium]
MNKLPLSKRVQILAMLCEGSSMRSISRVADVSINTVSKLLVEAGEAAIAIHSEYVQNVRASRIQCDEIWSFCYATQKTTKGLDNAPLGAGDVWTWTALDADTKLIVTYLVGSRDADCAMQFMDDLAWRLANRVQLTTDGHRPYLEAVEGAFGFDIDYAMLVKLYGEGPLSPERRYSPMECLGTRKRRVTGNPDARDISTSHVERQNLTMRMSMRRFTRLTNAFSKKWENHVHAISLYFFHYNFCRIHKSLRISPAMAAGITDTLWSFDELIAKMDTMAAPPAKRGPYKKRGVKLDNSKRSVAEVQNSN